MLPYLMLSSIWKSLKKWSKRDKTYHLLTNPEMINSSVFIPYIYHHILIIYQLYNKNQVICHYYQYDKLYKNLIPKGMYINFLLNEILTVGIYRYFSIY